jgi:hypothetical protein
MKISVTQDDIAKGQRVSASFCPIALASRRTFNNEVTVTKGEGIRVYKYPRSLVYSIPKNAVALINNFDHGGPVEPFTFETEEIIYD